MLQGAKKLFQVNVIFIEKIKLSVWQLDFMRGEYSKATDHPLSALHCIYVTSFAKLATKGIVSEVPKSLVLLVNGRMWNDALKQNRICAFSVQVAVFKYCSNTLSFLMGKDILRTNREIKFAKWTWHIFLP